MKRISWTLAFALILMESSGQQSVSNFYAFNPLEAEANRPIRVYYDSKSKAGPKSFDFSKMGSAYQRTRKATRGGILLKNIAWYGSSGLFIGTTTAVKFNEKPTLKNVLPLTVIGGAIGVVTGLVIGAVKAAQRKDDIHSKK